MPSSKHVLITGITGMDGSILADYLLSLGYTVYGLVRRSASSNKGRIAHLNQHPKVHLLDGDITDQESIHRAIERSQPEMIFNLAAQSFVPYSWDAPLNTFSITGMGALHILEAIRNIDRSIKFYQASSSEMFGKVLETPQKETTPFHPRSPYGVAKVAAHYATINYHESFGIHASSGILFNHEHERRGEHFVTRKISKGVAKYFSDRERKQPLTPITLGNLEAKRDWGYAEDYVKAMYKIINHPTPETFVVATGVTRTVKEWCEATVQSYALMTNRSSGHIDWKGSGEDEKGYFEGDLIFSVSKEFYRPAEVDLLLGDPTKAWEKLNWKPETPFEEMVGRMFKYDYAKMNLIHMATKASSDSHSPYQTSFCH
ncbi:MAG: GDP-mannose 4,6-dehydratase [Parachlamydiaceae bacterium]|nr:GDP-mannose 4,6-dehydratase [Parachlamydiaceae bacterium]